MAIAWIAIRNIKRQIVQADCTDFPASMAGRNPEPQAVSHQRDRADATEPQCDEPQQALGKRRGIVMPRSHQ
jgi:hypothetical protein